jgi:hypothetical protein
MSGNTSEPKKALLSFWIKLAYGTGDWSAASYGTLRQIFYAIFLTQTWLGSTPDWRLSPHWWG